MARRLLRVDDLVRRDASMAVVVTVAGLGFGVLLGAEAASGPGDAASAVDGGCSRAELDVIYGFVVTLIALTAAEWGSNKIYSRGVGTFLTFAVGTFAPLIDLADNIEASCHCVLMLWKYHKYRDSFPNILAATVSNHDEGDHDANGTSVVEEGANQNRSGTNAGETLVVTDPDRLGGTLAESGANRNESTAGASWRIAVRGLLSSLLPLSESRVRILASCDIFIYLNASSALLGHNLLYEYDENGCDLSEAMMIGEMGAAQDIIKRRLHREYYLLLVKAGILPEYKQLKFLRGKSGFAMVAIALQAVGYIYAVVYRSVTDLAVSPLEVVGLIFNIYILTKALLFSTCNPCYRPLLIIMDEKKERKLLEVLKADEKFLRTPLDTIIKRAAISLIALLICSNGVLIYYSMVLMKSINIIIVIPLFILLANSVLSFLLWVIGMMNFLKLSNKYLDGLCFGLVLFVPLSNAVVYVWAATATFQHWKSEHFNTRAKSINLSQIFPLLGSNGQQSLCNVMHNCVLY